MLLLVPGIQAFSQTLEEPIVDYDPTIDLTLTINIHSIRALRVIESISTPSFYVIVTINEQEHCSPTWENTEYVYDQWNLTVNIPDQENFVDITLALFDDNTNEDSLCDISSHQNQGQTGKDISLQYNIKTGHWFGDDYLNDQDGYGRACGTTDGSIYTDENDCELTFSITQNDYDNDGLPYWMETEVYDTDPLSSNVGEDADHDGIPIEWEHHWGFNPLVWDDHEHMDHDQDSITNHEEWITQTYGSDPFLQDVFLEIDFMEEAPDGTSSIVPNEAI